MAAPTPLRRLAVALLLASAPAGAVTPVAAVDVIPAEQGGERLPEATVTAVVGDVDGDGVRELIRLGPLADDETHVGVEVISADDAGQLTRHGMVPVRRLAGVEEQTEGQAVPDDRGMVAARIDEPARLLVWRVRGEERVLVTAIGTQDNPRACCLTIGEVGLDASRQTAITERVMISESASFIRAADLDADGTDELVVVEPPTQTAPGTTPVYVLRWVGGRFIRIEGSTRIDPADTAGPLLMPLGDSDGVPGEEIGLLAGAQSLGGSVLARVSLAADGSLRIGYAGMPFTGLLYAVATTEGGRLAVGTDNGASALLAWPADEREAVIARESSRRGEPVAVLGRESSARVLVFLNNAVDQLNEELVGVGITRTSAAVDVLSGTGLVAYDGPVPGGIAGAEAVVFHGNLLPALPAGTASDVPIQDRPIATLAGTRPIGTFGPEGLLVALAEGFVDATRQGGQLATPAGPRPGVALTVARTSIVLSGQTDDGRLEPALTGAVLVDRGPAGPLLITREGFSARIGAPAGSRILVYEDDEAREPAIVPSSGSADVGLPARAAQSTVRLIVITPSGHGYGATWAVRVVTAPPPLETSVPAASLGFSVTIRGHTAPDASVTVDGREAEVASDGTFSAHVGAGPIPREVEIRAVDAIGNETAATVSIVAPFDYRRLPWIPIVVAFTIVAGAVLYIRAPRPSPTLSRPAGDDAVLEEIE
ncbi:MAG TPA: hypothetical protein VFH90_06840 [Candidatus Limnocylindria bacterium]|nr:hypothetical protein [Candidatus Limnocylindria bacterium]